jgi:hypothetical protein
VLVFRIQAGKNALVCFVAVKVMKLTHAIVWILDRENIIVGGRTTFGTGVVVPSIVLPPARKNRALAALGHGSHDLGVVATSNIPQGIRGSNHSHSCLVVSGTNHFSHGRQQSNQKHCPKKIVVWADTMQTMLLELPHEDTGVEALYLHGESKRSKV